MSFSKKWIVLLNILVLLVIVFMDYKTGEEVSLSLFYLLPISSMTWYLGKWPGILMGILSALVAFWANEVLHHEPLTAVDFWNLFMLLGIFSVYAYSLSALKKNLLFLEFERSRSHELALEVISAQEKERKRIARELHDEASQALTGLSFKIEQMKLLAQESPTSNVIPLNSFEELKRTTSQVMSEIRQVAFNLRPIMLEDLGLGRSLSTLFRNHLKNQGIKVDFQVDNYEFRFSPDVELALFRICQEAVSNIIKHSKATHVTARLSKTSDKILLKIQDNGIGFNPEGQIGQNNHLGLFGMRERASLLSGKFQLTSTPGKGTSIGVQVPIMSSK